MSKTPNLVFCYDILLRYPELFANFPDNRYGDMAIGEPGPTSLAAQFDDCPSLDSLRLRDYIIRIPEYSLDALCFIRDDPTATSTARQHARSALYNIATALTAKKIHLYNTAHPSFSKLEPVSRPTTPTGCAIQAFQQFVRDSTDSTILQTYGPIIFVSNLPEIQARHSDETSVRLIPLHLPSPWQYHGIRYLLVPSTLVESFNANRQISSTEWRVLFPDAPPLQPNEYLAFYPTSPDTAPRELDERDPIVLHDPWLGADNYAYRTRLGRYSARDDRIEPLHIDPSLEIPRSPDGTGYPAYAAYLDALADPSISCVIVSGPAGSGKTFGAFNYARESVRSGQFIQAFVLKEGRNVLGAVKGGVREKMSPMVEFGKDALRNIELQSGKMHKKRREEAQFGRHDDPEGQPSSVYAQLNTAVELSWNNFFTCIPYEYAQGRSLPDAVIIADEFQRTDPDTAYTLLTRQANKSKLIVIGDIDQIFASTEQKRRVNGLAYASQLLYGAPQVAQIRLNLVLRHSIADFIVRNRRQVHLNLGLPL